ncbi:hypothetical protein BGZ83_000830 [Gryganskiella cystojenkinii]|nr:hypothetical protein BGZ83_000830 [Gryganskiella cystojenkinii]
MGPRLLRELNVENSGFGPLSTKTLLYRDLGTDQDEAKSDGKGGIFFDISSIDLRWKSFSYSSERWSRSGLILTTDDETVFPDQNIIIRCHDITPGPEVERKGFEEV